MTAINKIIHQKLENMGLLGLLSLALGLILLGGLVSTGWHSLHYPIKPLYVELYNETDQVISSVVIEHGNINTQERIQAIRLMPQERRIMVLNHKPRLGFSIEANYANGEKTSICAGKLSDSYFLRETFYRDGISTTSLR